MNVDCWKIHAKTHWWVNAEPKPKPNHTVQLASLKNMVTEMQQNIFETNNSISLEANSVSWRKKKLYSTWIEMCIERSKATTKQVVVVVFVFNCNSIHFSTVCLDCLALFYQLKTICQQSVCISLGSHLAVYFQVKRIFLFFSFSKTVSIWNGIGFTSTNNCFGHFVCAGNCHIVLQDCRLYDIEYRDRLSFRMVSDAVDVVIVVAKDVDTSCHYSIETFCQRAI